MPTYVERFWQPDDALPISRKDRAPGNYLAYVPDELGKDLPQLGVEATRAAEDAVRALARADERIGDRGKYLHHLLIRSESISSSWIEGHAVSPKKLVVAELLQHGSAHALAVVANVRATEAAISELADFQRAVSVDDLIKLQHTIAPKLQPGLRTQQNWVGGPGNSPRRADFVPPPESEVPRLMEDLARFVTTTDGNPVVRAAIAHAQFETIHPFIDGNGRTGRALIHTVLRRGDLSRHALIPISTVFASNTNAYIAGLTAYRSEPSQLDEWIIAFAEATEIAAGNAVRLSDEIEKLDQRTYQQLLQYRQEQGLKPVKPRKDAVVLRILPTLSSDPVLTAETVQKRFDVKGVAAQRALIALHEARILGRSKDPKGRVLCYTADQYLGLIALIERSNRVGGEDTRSQRPKAGPPVPNPDHVGYLFDN